MAYMVITPEILNMVMKWAERRTLISLGVTDEMLTDYPDIPLDTFVSLSPDHKAALQAFKDAYQAWYDLHFEIVRGGAPITSEQTVKLVSLSKLKDEKRDELITLAS